MDPRAFMPEVYQSLARRFAARGARLYAVGGLPRNACLGLPPSDLDVCSALPPEQVVSLCMEAGIRCVAKAPQFGTVELHTDGHVLEHTTFRSDVYGKDGGHHPAHVRFGQSLEEDAFRRDFTCNALYYDILRDEWLDPTGGSADIKLGLVRATSADPARIMRDDGLRVLRLVRFACELGFDVEPHTWAAACAHVGGLRDIAWERKRDELSKILLSDIRYPSLTQGKGHAVLKGLHMLQDMRALEHILPALLEGEGVAQRPRFHAYDVLEHQFRACAAAEPTLTLRLAGLLHDVGKPAALREKGLDVTTGGGMNTKPVELPRGMTPMLNHDRLGTAIAEDALRQLRFPNALIEDVAFLVRHHMYDLNMRAKSSTLRARFAQMGESRAMMLCAIREADIRGSGYAPDFVATHWRNVLRQMQEEKAPFSIGALACTGEDIMEWLSLSPGKVVGEIKQRMLRHCARHPQDNTKERLQRLAPGMLHGKKHE